MRLIDADALKLAICRDQCEKDGCDYTCSEIAYLVNAPTVAKDTNVLNNWISVKDRLPEKSDDYIVWIITGCIEICWYNGEEWIASDGCPWAREYVTHWQSMPKPPKEVEG